MLVICVGVKNYKKERDREDKKMHFRCMYRTIRMCAFEMEMGENKQN